MSGQTPDPQAPQSGDRLAGLQLEQAISRARLAIGWERLWPVLAGLLTVVGLFFVASWAGLWLSLPSVARAAGLLIFALLLIAASLPLIRFRIPSRSEALTRLDRNTGIRHRPATALTDSVTSQDPVTQALWRIQRERTLASIKSVKAGLPSPRLAIHDPWALRALVIVLLAVTAIAAGEERGARVAAAFDWKGVLAPSNVRLDAWVTPPAYTGRPPIILSSTATAPSATPASSQSSGAIASAMAVPSGSILVVRASGGRLDLVLTGAIAEAAPNDKPPPAGTEERRYAITGDATAQVRIPSGQPVWRFTAANDKPPSIALAKDPERQARGSLLLAYKLEDDYGVTEAHANFALRANGENRQRENARPLFPAPDFALTLPNARTRNGVGQTVKDLTEHPYAGADVTLTLLAKDEAGNEGRSAPFNLRMPERLFVKPLARALIEQRRELALDGGKVPGVLDALDALMIEPDLFMPEKGHYLGMRTIHRQLDRAKTDDDLREVVGNLWALAVTIEDGDISDVEKALRAAQEALKQALERGASDEEIKKLTDQLRAALDNFMKQLAEQLRNNPQQLARPLDPNARVLRQDDLRNMIDRMERLSRSGDKDAARQLLDQMQQMLENLQMAQPGQGGDSDAEQALNELGDIIRKEQQLRDRTFREGQDARRDRQRGERGQNQEGMNGLQQDQQALRDRLGKLLDQLNKQGMGPGQRGQQGQKGQGQQPGQQGQGQGDGEGDPLGDADTAMGDAEGQLGDGNPDGAAGSQGRAIEALRRGAQDLAQSMQQQGQGQQGEGDPNGPGDRPGRRQSSGANADPLGRPLRGREYNDDMSVRIPGEIDVQRVRRILEELRRRFSDPQRPQLELDYLERLLKDY